MAKNTPTEEPAAEQPASPAVQLTLNEFCMRLSEKEKRVELIGAFNFDESKAKRLKDTFEEYSKRYQDFIKKPA